MFWEKKSDKKLVIAFCKSMSEDFTLEKRGINTWLQVLQSYDIKHVQGLEQETDVVLESQAIVS